tara:strand:+ start:283 stop:456 length:174 start_codon:yes stop_codon:yes gene_type:complete
MNKYKYMNRTEEEIENAIAEGELRQERELERWYEDGCGYGSREAEQEDAYNRGKGIY